MISTRLAAVVATTAILQGVVAQTSLYIPGFDPQPVTANVIGVGADGRTTWRIAPGQPSGTLQDSGFHAPATLIQGPEDVQVILNEDGLSINESCKIANGIADCTVIAAVDGTTTTDTVQETVSAFPIQGGGTLSGSISSPTSPGSSAISSAPTTVSPIPSGSAPPSQTSSPPKPDSGSIANGVTSSHLFVGIAGIIAALSVLC